MGSTCVGGRISREQTVGVGGSYVRISDSDNPPFPAPSFAVQRGDEQRPEQTRELADPERKGLGVRRGGGARIPELARRKRQRGPVTALGSVPWRLSRPWAPDVPLVWLGKSGPRVFELKTHVFAFSALVCRRLAQPYPTGLCLGLNV